ncbi:FAD-dependent oxidoreductase [Ruminococcus sp.]|uniref:NAD(P)/FAD-dependent oxidoreductase n=1 Tax=Ruminococcus sp. TaxID=41978 RepID=UPI00261AA4D4|nr:FAD-dependent oxidoreductase [Ruminococcus sp.]MDD7556317.1 FAD-dependent oxidoreductase [Ruminococcus sp.]MDY4963376.1 FAD-dependent oxidoreductase [Ruminococcus callidus]
MYDVLIAGGGIAGLTAALYAARAGCSTLMLEQQYYGGQIVNAPLVENYPGIHRISGAELAQRVYDQALAAGAQYANAAVERAEPRDGGFALYTNRGIFAGRGLILATGAGSRPLGLDREQALTGHGVSYCAACDGGLYRGKDVAVAGGGNTALSDCLLLAQGCRRVYLIHRRSSFRGEASLLEQVRRQPNVELLTDATVTELLGEQRLEGIRIRQRRLRTLKVEGLFIAVGRQPRTEAFAGLVALDPGGYIRAGEDCRTTMQQVFCAGDCRSKSIRQLCTAAADGAAAAIGLCESLSAEKKQA